MSSMFICGNRHLFPFFYVLLCFTTLWAAGNYTTVKPASIQVPSDPFITSNITGPVLTTDWCASLVFDSVSNNMFGHPLAFKCEHDGIWLGYPNKGSSAKNHYTFPFHKDVKVSISGLSNQKALLHAYNDWSATASWRDGDLKVTMGHGMPYSYITSTSGIEVEIAGNPIIWYNINGTIGLTMGDRHYGIFAPSGSGWIVNGKVCTSTLNDKGYVSIAALPDTQLSTIEYFRKFAYNFITDTKVSWEYDRAGSTVITKYQVSIDMKEGTERHVLYALYPHQWQYYSGPFTSYTYNSVRGPMKVVEAESFTTVTPFTGILPNLPLIAEKSSQFNLQTLKTYIDIEQAKTADQLIRSNSDTYWTGKDLGRTAQLVRIAEQVGDTAARDHFLSAIKSKLEDWFTYTEGENAEFFYYNQTWGTLIGVNASFGSDAHVNDHHFHYGYYVMAAATVAQYDRAWAREWENMVELVIRDCNSPYRGDTLFPFMRAFDIYAGHCWASGDAAFASGNNQESTSEAINFAAGTALWGIATHDTTMRNLGIFLYATETASLTNYWLDINEIVFPNDFNHTMVGMIWGDKADYATWFSAEPECIHGINMLPFTAASLYLGNNRNYVIKNYSEIVQNNGGPVNDWQDIMWMYLALGDPGAAVSALANNLNYTPEDGESRAHTYHWIQNMAAAGMVTSGITADIPCYAVFDSNGIKTYAMYNESDTIRSVLFSNGMRFSAPPRSLIYANPSQGTHTTVVSASQIRPAMHVVENNGSIVGTIYMNSKELPDISFSDISGRKLSCDIKLSGDGVYQFKADHRAGVIICTIRRGNLVESVTKLLVK